MKFKNEAGLVNCICTVFELGDKMLTLSSMENLIVQCNLKKGYTKLNTHEIWLCLFRGDH